MYRRNRNSLIALVVMAMAAPAVAAQPWPEAHTGSYLGVQIAAVTAQQASVLKLPEASGAVITYVDQDGPACHAGLLENDVVVAFEGSKVDNPAQLQGLIHATPPQKTVTLTVMRGGQRKDVKVTLGSWNIMSNARTMTASTLAVPGPPRAFMPDVEVPSFTLLASRHGLVVESLSPQLADFFGVPHGHGVLVRSVEGGSPAAAAGLKAGDVILKVNNETVHDMADWQRGMHTPGTKLSVGIWRDRREQTLVINVRGPGDSSRLTPSESLDFDTDAQLLREQMEALWPQIEADEAEMTAQLGPSEKDLEHMRRDLEKGMKKQQKDMAKMARDMAKSARPLAKDMGKMSANLEKSLPSQKEMEAMRQEIQKSIPSAKDMDEMKRQVMESMPSGKDLDEMRQQMQDAMKAWTPELQKQMEELRKQMEQQKFDWQKMMQDDQGREQF
jgi:serine protease Do